MLPRIPVEALVRAGPCLTYPAAAIVNRGYGGVTHLAAQRERPPAVIDIECARSDEIPLPKHQLHKGIHA